MYRIVCSNPYSVDKSVDIEDDDDDEEVSEIDWHFITSQAGLEKTGLFFSIVSNFNFKCFSNLYLRTIRYVLCHKQ